MLPAHKNELYHGFRQLSTEKFGFFWINFAKILLCVCLRTVVCGGRTRAAVHSERLWKHSKHRPGTSCFRSGDLFGNYNIKLAYIIKKILAYSWKRFPLFRRKVRCYTETNRQELPIYNFSLYILRQQRLQIRPLRQILPAADQQIVNDI